MQKALGWFDQQIKHKLQRNLTENSALVNSDSVSVFAFLTSLHSKSAMPIFMKVVCLSKLHIFPLGDFEVFSEFLENVPKF
jgi:hypothetical protein